MNFRERNKMKKTGFLVIIIMLLLSLTSVIAEEGETNKFSITQIAPENLRPSEVTTVSITIKNIGTSSAYYVAAEVLIDEKSPVKILGRTKKTIGTSSPLSSLGIDREVVVQYDFYIDSDAKATIYSLPLKITWSDESQEPQLKTETLYFGIRVSGQSKEARIDVLNVTTVPSDIEPGTKAILEIALKNIGYSTVSLLTARLHAENPFTPLDSDLDEYIYELKPGEIATAQFTIAVDINAPSSYYEIPLILTYDDEYGVHLQNTTIGIPVKGAPRIFIQEIILEPGKLTTGIDGLFMIRLINTGTESAEDTKIRISGAQGILTEDHQFIGEIAPGESQTTTFGVSVNEEAGIGKHGLTIIISYEDKSGASYSNSKIYEISIFAAESFLSSIYFYVLIAIVVVSLIIYVIIKVRFKKEGVILRRKSKHE